MNHRQNTYIASLLGYDGTEDEENEQEQQASLSDMTPEQLYQLNLPLRTKLDTRQEMTQEESDLHFAICLEVSRRMEAQRKQELAVRLANAEPAWKTCQCESCAFVRSVLLS